MSRFEKLLSIVFVVIISISIVFFGVREDKIRLTAPVITGICFLSVLWMSRNRMKNSLWETIPPCGILLFLFWVYGMVLIPFSVLPYEAKITGLGFGSYLLVYWIFSNLGSDFSGRKAVWMPLLLLLMAVAVYSLIQHQTAPEMLFNTKRYTDYWEAGRLGGTYQCPNHIAHLYLMWLPFCMAFLFMPCIGWFWRICSFFSLPLFSYLIFQTQSRAGILGAVAAVAATALLLILRKSRWLFCLALIVIPLLGAAGLGVLWSKSEVFQKRMTPVVEFINHVSSGAIAEKEFRDFRPQTWLDTIEMIKDNPEFGTGPGSYGAVFEQYRKRFWLAGYITVHPHNEYLEVIAEYGRIGAVFVFFIIAVFSIRLLRFAFITPESHHAFPAIAFLGALAGTAVHGFFDFELRNLPNALMLACLAGTVVSPMLRRKEGENKNLLNKTVNIITAAAMLAVACWVLLVMSSALLRGEGDDWYKSGNYEQALKIYNRSIALDSQNWRGYVGAGQIYFRFRYYELNPELKREWMEKEKDAFQRAYQINPLDPLVLFGFGSAEIASGNRTGGLEYLQQAAKHRPFNGYYWRKLGIELRKAGLYSEAATAFHRASQLNRSNPTVRRNIQWLKEQAAEKQQK